MCFALPQLDVLPHHLLAKPGGGAGDVDHPAYCYDRHFVSYRQIKYLSRAYYLSFRKFGFHRTLCSDIHGFMVGAQGGAKQAQESQN